MLFDTENNGKNNRIDSFPDQYYGPIDTDLIKQKIGKMVESGVYSYYRGNGSEHFWGGPEVKRFEKMIEQKFDCKALAVNSCTSALFAACAAIGIQPKDEVIVTGYSMVCSATVPMWFGGIPVFADIEKDYFCLDPEDIEKKITNKTRAIIVVDLFGQPADYAKIMGIAEKHNLYVIEDAAQAIGSYAVTTPKKYAGTFGHIGCFSFTQGKHLTSGEGGAIVTNDPELYAKCALIRNHAEAVMNDGAYVGYEHLIGLNLRMTEIQAVILQEQFKCLDDIVAVRRTNVEKIMEDMPDCISLYPTREGYIHSYYVMPLKYTGKDIKRFVDLVKRNLLPEKNRVDRGVPIGAGYIKPLYKFPCFQADKKHWSIRDRDYSDVICLETEKANYELIVNLTHGLHLNDKDVRDIQFAFHEADRIVNG